MGRLSWLGLVLLSPMIFGCANQVENATSGGPLPGGANLLRSLDVDGVTRWFRLVAPASSEEQPAAMIWLHGATRSMYDILAHAEGADWLALAERNGFLLVLPNGTDHESGDAKGKRQHWNDYRSIGGRQVPEADDVAFISALARWLVSHQQVDPQRLYIGGASNGGMMTFRLLQDSPGLFAGAVAYIANLPLGTPSSPGILARPTPLFYLVGSADPLIPPAGGSVGTRGAEGEVRSQAATLAWWLDYNRAPLAPTTVERLPDADELDGCQLIVAEHRPPERSPKANEAPVRHVLMQGGGHAPTSLRHKTRAKGRCRDANAAELAWDFLRTQP